MNQFFGCIAVIPRLKKHLKKRLITHKKFIASFEITGISWIRLYIEFNNNFFLIIRCTRQYTGIVSTDT